MHEQQGETLRAVAWRQVFPWLLLVRVFRLAISFRLLLLSAVGVLLTLTGWTLFSLLFSSDPRIAEQIQPYRACPWLAATALVPDRPRLLDAAGPMLGERPRWPLARPDFERDSMLDRHPVPLVGGQSPIGPTWLQLSRPTLELFRGPWTAVRLAYLVLCALWTLAVWSFFGACVVRFAAVQLAVGERMGWGSMFQHAAAKWPAHLAAPLFPLLAVLLMAAPVALLGFLLLRWSVTVPLAVLFWPLALLAAALMAVLLLGLLFGWPLMWATIGTEATDSFDALSRSYNYTFQRPLHYGFYALVCGILGYLGWLLVRDFAAAVVALGYGAAGLGAGQERVAALAATSDELSGWAWAGAIGIRFWVGVVKLLAVGYLYSFFWTSAAGIYLLLRRDIDATPTDEVVLVDRQEGPFGLPPITTDAAGAPEVNEDAPAQEGQRPE